MKLLNVIGAGRVGRTLASLWQAQRTFSVQDVLDGNRQGALSGVEFIGAGRAVAALAEMQPAEVWMITTPDRSLAQSAEKLGESGLLRKGDVVFHCSGSMGSADLQAAAARGAHIASVHPLKSFADSADAVRTFAGTYCAIEGDSAALEILKPAFEQIGGLLSEIDPQFKTIYHGASVVVSNYLTALMEMGLRCYEKAGVPRDMGAAMMEPIVRETLDNVFKRGTVKALTGPIARGDVEVVARHIDALTAWDPKIAAAYRDLGAIALELARARGEVERQALVRLGALLRPGS